jgi:hypothetical protein
MQSSSGFSRYKTFAANIEAKDREITCFIAHIISDNEALAPTSNNNDNLFTVEESKHTPTLMGETAVPSIQTAGSSGPSSGPSKEPHIIETFKQLKAGLPQQEYKQVESKLHNLTHELLQWHYKLGHKSFRHLKWMAKARIIPIHLAACRVPKCSACYYGKASWRMWREKDVASKKKIATATAPSQMCQLIKCS